MPKFYVVTRSGSIYAAQQRGDGSWRVFENGRSQFVLGRQLLPTNAASVLVLGETIAWECADGTPDLEGGTSSIVGIFLDWDEAAECRRLWKEFRSRTIVMAAPSRPASPLTMHNAMLVAIAAMGEWANLKIDRRWLS